MSFYICALDDDESTLYTLEAMACTQCWNFRGTTDAAEFIGWVRDVRTDILLLDYHMPAGNGLDILRKIRSVSPDIPVLMLTVEQDPATAEALLLAGADDFINKPVRLADFLSRIRLHRRLKEQEKYMNMNARKGISPDKLRKVVEFLKANQDGAGIETLVEECGLSYTTAHRYLDHLVKAGHVISTETPQYGKPGRPTLSYKFVGIRGEKP